LVGVQSINEEGVDVDDLGIMHWGENIKESSNGCQLKESVVNMVGKRKSLHLFVVEAYFFPCFGPSRIHIVTIIKIYCVFMILWVTVTQ